jgi:UDP-N-acetylmuramyl tripeptide synthase
MLTVEWRAEMGAIKEKKKQYESVNDDGDEVLRRTESVVKAI